MKQLTLIYSLLLLTICLPLQAQKKTDLSVLYIGGKSDIQTLGVRNIDTVAVNKSAKERSASFTALLRKYFKTVKSIHQSAYKPEMSDAYDVTVFDGTPNPLREREYVRNEEGRIMKVIPAAYLPADYNRPTLCIAEISEAIGRSLGSKNDWYCLCLDADALGWKADHPIFNTPYKVDIKPVLQPTPATALEMGRLYRQDVTDSIPMWSVQTKGYLNTKNYAPGMVSRPGGYLDSPDAEVISGGVSAKTLDAVAIGRHGNLFHWGFVSAPYDMTEAGKIAFINSIVYISKFAEAPIARKTDDRITTRDYADHVKYMAGHEAWESQVKNEREFAKSVQETKKNAEAKLAKGEALDEMEKIYLTYQTPPEKTYSQYLQGTYPHLFPVFGEEASEYVRYYERNRPYFYPNPDGYGLIVDEDVRSLGIANNDLKLLEKAITLLERGEDVEKATRILHRYTLCRFATPAQWREWLNTYRDKMFFTESGGWIWLVHSTDRNIPGNDYTAATRGKDEAISGSEASEGETDHNNPVYLSASAKKTADGKVEIEVYMKVHTGYHIYAQVSDKDPFLATNVKFDLPDGYQVAGDLKNPGVKKLNENGTTVYEGSGVFRQVISGTGSGEVKCTVEYQCCDHTICFPPIEKVLSVQIP